MNRLTVDQIKQIAASALTSRPSTVPDWVWAMPWAHEPYSRFLHMLAQELQPELVVELGTDNGTSAAFLATATPARVVSIDYNVTSSRNLRELATTRGLPNLAALCGDTVSDEILETIASAGTKIGLLYVDSNHTFEHATRERALYHPLMAPGGVVVYDDVRFNEGMARFWDGLDDVKIELPELHWTSFGATVMP